MKEKTRHGLKELGGCLAVYVLVLVITVIVMLLYLAGGLPPGVPGK